MNPLIERLRQVMDLPTGWLIEAIDRTARYTDQQKEEAMRYVIKSADIGETEEIEIVEIPEPVEVPMPEPVEEPVPA